MKAIRLVEVGKPLQLQDVPVPAVGEGDVLVRVRAAGICHSDAHYRAGISAVHPLPMTLGHEIAGTIEKVGSRVTNARVGDRVCIHYNVTCGQCFYCITGNDQFCEHCKMLGHHADGGYAEFTAVPERNVVSLPAEIPFEQGATLMCASATSYHALRKSRLRAGETVAVFGVGGLGISAVQIAKILGASEVFAVDINKSKLNLAASYGAIPVNARELDPVAEIRRLTNGKGTNVALELLGLPQTMQQAVRCLEPLGRAVIAGITDKPLQIDTYRELLGSEAEIIGSNDHLLQELPVLVDLARRKILDTTLVVTRTVPLHATAINEALDSLEMFGSEVRVAVVP